jgi:hypothetical protein
MTMYDLAKGKKLWSVSASMGDDAWFSADGKTIYSSHANGATLSAWSALDGTALFTLDVGSNAGPLDLVDVAGHLRIAALDGQQVDLTDWRLDVADLVDAACREANRNLTAVEWTQYVGSFDPYERTCTEIPAPTPRTATGG